MAVACLPPLPVVPGVSTGETDGPTTASSSRNDADEGRPTDDTSDGGRPAPTGSDGNPPGDRASRGTDGGDGEATTSSMSAGPGGMSAGPGGDSATTLTTRGADTGDADTSDAACGDGRVTRGEQCDGSDLQGYTCVSFGLSVGTLSCDPITCTFDTSMCMSTSGGTGG